jgi:hypothetical protein
LESDPGNQSQIISFWQESEWQKFTFSIVNIWKFVGKKVESRGKKQDALNIQNYINKEQGRENTHK